MIFLKHPHILILSLRLLKLRIALLTLIYHIFILQYLPILHLGNILPLIIRKMRRSSASHIIRSLFLTNQKLLEAIHILKIHNSTRILSLSEIIPVLLASPIEILLFTIIIFLVHIACLAVLTV